MKHKSPFIYLIIIFLQLYLPTQSFGISSEKEILVSCLKDFSPYEFINKNGEPDGYHIDLINAIAKISNIKIKFITGSWNENRIALDSGKIQIIPGMCWTKERENRYHFSNTHTYLNYCIFVRKNENKILNPRQLIGRKIVIPRGGIMSDILKKYTDEIEINYVNGETDALDQLSQGKYDCTIYLRLKGLLYANEKGYKNLKPLQPPIHIMENCFAFKKNNRKLLTMFNEGFTLLKDRGELRQIHNKWFGKIEESSFWKKLYPYIIYLIWLLLGIIFLFLLIIFWNNTLKKHVRLRTEKLADEIKAHEETEEKLLHSRKELRLFLRNQQTRIDKERKYIARAVHDELGQIFTALKLYLSTINSTDKKILKKMEKSINHGVTTVKAISSSLRAHLLEDLNLEGAISQLAIDTENNHNIAFEVDFRISTDNFSEIFSEAIFRICQESITNIVKHSKAASASIRFYQKDNQIILSIEDDGIGIFTEDLQKENSFGLIGIREWVLSCNGTFKFEKVHPKGLCMIFNFPEENLELI